VDWGLANRKTEKRKQEELLEDKCLYELPLALANGKEETPFIGL
jgi:hypothetical protein